MVRPRRPPSPPGRVLSAAVKSRLEARKDFECTVCVSLLHVPVVLVDCGYSVCVGCTLRALSVKHTCPTYLGADVSDAYLFNLPWRRKLILGPLLKSAWTGASRWKQTPKAGAASTTTAPEKF